MAALGSLALLFALPEGWGLCPLAQRLAYASLALLPLGVLLGVFFPLGLRGAPPSAVATAYLWDAFGTALGFHFFHAIALPLGIGSALFGGVLAYGVAWSLRPR